VGAIASGIAVSLLKNSIMTEKLARRGLHVYQEYDTDILKLTKVHEVMDKNPALVYSNERISDLADKIAGNGFEYNSHKAYPVIDEKENLVGIVTQGDLLKAFDQDQTDKTVMEVAAANPVVTYADETVFDALSKMLKQNVGRLPVVERENPKKLVGYLGRANVLSSRLKQIEEESVFEKKSGFLIWKNKPEVAE
jgi:CBS domain-containing protein